MEAASEDGVERQEGIDGLYSGVGSIILWDSRFWGCQLAKCYFFNGIYCLFSDKIAFFTGPTSL